MAGFADPASEDRGQELVFFDHRLYRPQHCSNFIDDRHGDFQIPIASFVES
jgi:hypothetical protein